MRSIHHPLKAINNVLAGIDYFSKWAEAVPLTNVDKETVVEFIQSHTMCRYGTPETITTDHRSIFIGIKVMEFAAETGIKFLTSTPYYAQANDQVEARNKVIVSLINNT